ncbi:MAG: MFS transporter [Solirubrobacteraceae bacterium]
MIAAYAFLGSASQLLWLTFTPITTPAAHHYGVSVSDVGWLSEIFPLFYVLLAVPAASLLDRWFRPTLAIGAFLTALGGVLRLGGAGFGWALAGQLLIALAQPLVLNAVTGLASAYLSPESRPAGIAIGSAGIFMGMLVSLALGSALGGGQIHALLVVDAVYGVMSGAGLLVALALGEHPPISGENTGMHGLRTVWRDRDIRRLAGVAFIGFGLFVAFTTWFQALLKPAGIHASAAGWVLVATVTAGVIGAALLPPLVARRRADHLLYRLAAGATCAACVLFALWKWVPAISVAACLFGFLLLACLPVLLEVAERLAGGAGTSATALIWLSGNAGGIVLALLMAAVVHHPLAGFLLMAAIALIVLGIIAREPVAQ